MKNQHGSVGLFLVPLKKGDSVAYNHLNKGNQYVTAIEWWDGIELFGLLYRMNLTPMALVVRKLLLMFPWVDHGNLCFFFWEGVICSELRS